MGVVLIGVIVSTRPAFPNRGLGRLHQAATPAGGSVGCGSMVNTSVGFLGRFGGWFS